ncbi:MAG: hypothetical protein QOJ21_2687 [Solirubrobacteraceae bacterium]|nr:hypothetical protein [Solirubrobacteraceae bacterium]
MSIVHPRWTSARRPAHRRSPRASIIAAAAVIAAAVLAAPAQAGLGAVGPVNPATRYPDWYQDGNGLKLQLCLDGPPFCLAAAADLVAPNGEAFYWQAAATVPVGSGTADLTLAQEAAFLNGGRITFGRVRVRVLNGPPNSSVVANHPYGTTTVDTDATGKGTTTEDIGCGAAPCDFSVALGTTIGPFLTWDPRVGPAPPAGYVGDSVTPHAVVGSPIGSNRFSVGAAATNLFTVQGKLAGPPVPVFNGPGSTDFGTQPPGLPTTRTVTIESFGVPAADGTSNLAVGAPAISGANAAEFGILANTCTGVSMPSGATCAITVAFNPAAPGAKTAVLDIPHNAQGALSHVALAGAGAPPPPPPAAPAAGPAVTVAGAGAAGSLALQQLRLTHRVTRARVLRRGLRLSMRVSEGTEVVRVAIYRTRRGKRSARPVYLAFRLVPRAGVFRLTLDSRALRQRLKPGRYQLNVTPGQSRRQLGSTTKTFFRVTSR